MPCLTKPTKTTNAKTLRFSIPHSSEDPKADKGMVLWAVKQVGWALKWAPEEPTAVKKVVLEAVKQNGQARQWAYEELKRTSSCF